MRRHRRLVAIATIMSCEQIQIALNSIEALIAC
jgi:hypothetical protein